MEQARSRSNLRDLRVSRNSPGTWTADYGSWHLGGLVKVVVQGGSKFKVRRKIAELAETEGGIVSDRGIEGGLLLVYLPPDITEARFG